MAGVIWVIGWCMVLRAGLVKLPAPIVGASDLVIMAAHNLADHPMGNPPPPEGYGWSLPLLYVVWGVAMVLLYFPCRWFAALKARRRDWWLSYL